MSKLILLVAIIFCVTVPEPVAAQNAQAYKVCSDSFYSINQFDSALHYARRAETHIIDTFSKNSIPYAWFVGQFFSMNYEALRMIDSASYWYEYSIHLFETLHDTTSVEYGETLTNYGNLLNKNGFYTKSYPYLQKAVIVLNRYPDALNSFLGSKNNLATYYTYTGEYYKAELYYLEVYDIIQKNPGIIPEIITTANVGILLQNLAIVNARCGYTSQADKYYRMGLDSLRKDSSATDNYYKAINNYAVLCTTDGRLTQAELILKDALDDDNFQTGKTGNPTDNLTASYALVLSSLGNVYELYRNNIKAELLYKQSVTAAGQLTILPFVKYAAMGHLAHLYTSKRLYQKADSLYQLLIPEIESQPDRESATYTKIYGDYCENLLHLNQTEKAAQLIQSFTKTLLDVMDSNIGGMPEESQMRYVASLERYISLMFSALATNPVNQQNLVGFSLNNLLHLKGLVLNMQMQKIQSSRSATDTILPKLYTNLKIIKEALYKQYTSKNTGGLNPENLASEARAYERKISAMTGIWNEQANTSAADEIRKKLHNKSAAVEYVYYTDVLSGNKMYGAFITRPDKQDPAFVVVCSEKKLKESAVRSATHQFEPVAQLHYPGKIYQLVWKPLEQHVAGCDTIFYSPAGMLNYISFDAITYGPEKYLLHKKYFALLSGTRNLLNQKDELQKISSAVLWGNIDCWDSAYTTARTASSKPQPIAFTKGLPDDLKKGGGAAAFPPLPKDELPAIIALARQKKLSVEVFEKDRASEENFKQHAASYSGVLHISSHGYYYSQPKATVQNVADSNAFRTHINPLLRCGLILKGGNHAWISKQPYTNREDGILTGYEIALMDLSKVKLAVLSACETGLGDIDAGSEGVLGLQRAFKLAGVNNMVLSLWSVNATSTRELMTHFYNYLLDGLNPAAALRLAKIKMAKNNPPYAWAGFVLVE